VLEFKIPLPPNADCVAVATIIEESIADVGLTVTMLGSLKKFPGCVHWHVKQGREAGTLEITLWPREQKAWFSIQAGRAAAWIEEKRWQLAARIQERLRLRVSEGG
jgi:hypothetical protein